MRSTYRGKRLWPLVLPLLILLTTVAPAWAAGPATLQLAAPERVALGDEVTVTAVLQDGKGAPNPAATIILWTGSTFLSVGGALELGRATTDSQGRASFLYQARSEKSVTLNASFPGDSRYEAAMSSAQVTVEGSAQLYQSTAGVRVPGVGVWLLAGLLGGVWSIYLAVMVFLTLIAREGSKSPS